MSLLPQLIQVAYQGALSTVGSGSVVKDRDESKQEKTVDSTAIQEILKKECQIGSNFQFSPTIITKISADTEAQLKIHGPALKSLNLYVLIADDVYEDQMVEVRWDSRLLCNAIFPHLKQVETLKLPDYSGSLSGMSQLSNLSHLELDSELMQYLGRKGIQKASVTYSVDAGNKELNEYLFQLLLKIFHESSKVAGPNLKSLKITYHRDTVRNCLPALEALQRSEGGFVVKSADENRVLDISINSPKVPMEALVLKASD